MEMTGGRVAIVMGSQSDWPTMKAAAEVLDELEVSYEARITSAHRTPDRMAAFAKGAEGEGFDVIIAGAGGAAHLPGMSRPCTFLYAPRRRRSALRQVQGERGKQFGACSRLNHRHSRRRPIGPDAGCGRLAIGLSGNRLRARWR